MLRRSSIVWIWVGYISFVVYGSLVPLQFEPRPLDQAWATFLQIPFLKLGVESRADWIANGVLYFPVGFLTAYLFSTAFPRTNKVFAHTSAILLGVVLAVAVEFAQVFFPPRTVSLNDLLAESIGTVLGVIVAFHCSQWFHELLATLAGKYDQLASRALQAYAVGYLAISLFPFDFVLSAGELGAKLDSDAWGWFLAGEYTNRSVVVLIAKLLAEMLGVLPLGIMLGRWNLAGHRSATQNALLLGATLGLALEGAQFFLYSGVSQGASLLTRAAGLFLGAVFWRDRLRMRDLLHSKQSGYVMPPLAGVYLLALMSVNGWFDHARTGLAGAAKTYGETHFLPFYYHYYTSEQAALLSLMSVALMYSPFGVLAWVRHWSARAALWLAAAIAAVIEIGKLFLEEMHPDPTNLLIAGFAAWIVTRILEYLSTMPAAGTNDLPVSGKAPAQSVSAATPARLPARAWFALVATTASVCWFVVDFPVHPLLVGSLLIIYACLLWFKPWMLWAAIPAAIPLLNLAPWSGRFFLDEFDFVVLISLFIGYARTRAPVGPIRRDPVAVAVAGLLSAAFAVATLRALLPLPTPDANSFISYYSPYNALQVAKGALWAGLLSLLLRRFATGKRDIRALFAVGMILGLSVTVLVVLWERMVFPGLFNFTDVYRVTGPFFQMHTGGADIETYLCAAVPFATLFLVTGRSHLIRLALALLLIGASYSIMVTFSRAGYAGFALALVVTVLVVRFAKPRDADAKCEGTLTAGLTATAGSSYRIALPMALLASAAMVALTVLLSGSFARERISSTHKDFSVRAAHWEDALSMRTPGLVTELFGMGIGSFPANHYWRSSEPKAASYNLISESGNSFLRLGTGLPLYVEQLVDVEPGQDYVLRLDIRGAQPGAGVSIALCEKWLLTSGRCQSLNASVRSAEHQWEHYDLHLASGDIGSRVAGMRPTVKLSLFNASNAAVDIDNLQLLTAQGAQASANGDFSRRFDHWFFSVDNDLPWHIWSAPVALLFEQGWFGLTAFGMLMYLGVRRSSRQARRGDRLAGAVLASLLALLVIALVDTVVDAPRFLLLLILLAAIAIQPGGPQTKAGSSAR